MASAAIERHHLALLGVFEDAPQFLGGLDVECPVCHKVSPPSWRPFQTELDGGIRETSLLAALAKDALNQVTLDWMRCAHEECEQLLIRIHERTVEFRMGRPVVHTDSWIARPHFADYAERPINALVLEPFRRDYSEASIILEVSPRMSAVLARRIVGDLLKKYADKKQWGLTDRIRSFIDEGGHPSSLTTNLDHLREIADFGAHTQEAETQSDTGEMEVVIIDADRDDAEWTLDLVDRLFDYFIVTPAKDEGMRSKWDTNIAKTGRKPLRSKGEDQS
jgi:hypothetical protein